MPAVTPSSARSSASFRNGLLTVIIPAPKSPALLFSGVWLIFGGIIFFWAIKFAILISLAIIADQGGSLTITSVLVPLFFIFWLFMWGTSVFRSLRDLLWHLFGREELEISDYLITLRRSVWGKGRSKSYQMTHVERWRVDCSPISGSQRFFGGPDVTCLAFDYGADTVRFGVGIAEAEARSILEKVQGYFPGYKGKIILQ